MSNEGTWIDWQYLRNAAALLAKVWRFFMLQKNKITSRGLWIFSKIFAFNIFYNHVYFNLLSLKMQSFGTLKFLTVFLILNLNLKKFGTRELPEDLKEMSTKTKAFQNFIFIMCLNAISLSINNSWKRCCSNVKSCIKLYFFFFIYDSSSWKL